MRRSVALLLAPLIFSSACGGSSKNPAAPNNPPSGASSMSASIDGTAWTAIAVTAGKAPGTLIVSGSDVVRTLTVSFAATATGSQTIGPNSVALGMVVIGGQSWQANAVGTGGGTVNITTLTANRVVGTFTFTAVGGQGATPASRQVTNGKFDVRY